MIWWTIIGGVLFIGFAIVLWKMNKVKNVFDELLVNFVMSNQDNYTALRNVNKKLSTNTENLFKQVKELNQIDSIINNLGDMANSLSDTLKNMKSTERASNELKMYVKEIRETIKTLVIVSKNLGGKSHG